MNGQTNHTDSSEAASATPSAPIAPVRSIYRPEQTLLTGRDYIPHASSDIRTRFANAGWVPPTHTETLHTDADRLQYLEAEIQSLLKAMSPIGPYYRIPVEALESAVDRLAKALPSLKANNLPQHLLKTQTK